jgi:hypothetical protein
MKQYLLDPYNTDIYLDNKLFDGPYGLLRDELAKRGIELNTYDRGDLATADQVLFLCYNERLYRRCVEAGLERDRLVLLAYEPRVVMPEQYEPAVWEGFGKVFTFLSDRVDNQHVFPLRFIQAQQILEPMPGYDSRNT